MVYGAIKAYHIAAGNDEVSSGRLSMAERELGWSTVGVRDWRQHFHLPLPPQILSALQNFKKMQPKLNVRLSIRSADHAAPARLLYDLCTNKHIRCCG